MTQTSNHPKRPGFLARRVRGTQRYFGFDGSARTWRQRLAIFAANERRSLARLLGTAEPGPCCGDAPPPDVTAGQSGTH